MKKKQDLRVRRTKMNIENAFLELLKERPIEKITVTELAERAMINKGTFYLHYQDIYDLYYKTIVNDVSKTTSTVQNFELFFDAPEIFVSSLMNKLKERLPFKEIFSNINPKALDLNLPEIITDSLKENLYKTGRIRRTECNDIRLECAISCIFAMGIKHSDSNCSFTVSMIADVIKTILKDSD